MEVIIEARMYILVDLFFFKSEAEMINIFVLIVYIEVVHWLATPNK